MDTGVIIFLTSFLIPLVCFVFGRMYLESKKYLKFFLITFSTIAIIGIVMLFGIDRDNGFSVLLIVPLISYLIYQIGLKIFIAKFKRYPIDTAMDWRDGLHWDRLFNIGYLIIGILLPFGVVLGIITNGFRT